MIQREKPSPLPFQCLTSAFPGWEESQRGNRHDSNCSKLITSSNNRDLALAVKKINKTSYPQGGRGSEEKETQRTCIVLTLLQGETPEPRSPGFVFSVFSSLGSHMKTATGEMKGRQGGHQAPGWMSGQSTGHRAAWTCRNDSNSRSDHIKTPRTGHCSKPGGSIVKMSAHQNISPPSWGDGSLAERLTALAGGLNSVCPPWAAHKHL